MDPNTLPPWSNAAAIGLAAVAYLLGIIVGRAIGHAERDEETTRPEGHHLEQEG